MTRHQGSRRSLTARALGVVGFSFAVAVAAGCRTAGEVHDVPVAASPHANWHVVGHSVEGRPLECAILGDGPVTVLVMASIHGDEAAGTPLVRELAMRLSRRSDWLRDRRVIVLPEANPDGVARRHRRNARGVDLNRNFPAANWRSRTSTGPDPLSEPEARVVHDLVRRYAVDRIITFHQAANLLDYDGPGMELAEAMAAVSPLQIERMGARPGSLGSWAGVDHGLPTITVEMPRGDDHATPAELWERYGRLLVAAIRHPEGIRGAVP